MTYVQQWTRLSLIATELSLGAKPQDAVLFQQMAQDFLTAASLGEPLLPTVITDPQTGDTLVFDGTSWVNIGVLPSAAYGDADGSEKYPVDCEPRAGTYPQEDCCVLC